MTSLPDARRPAQEPREPECFVVMPISDPDGYDPGHFQHVYDDILAPACRRAGYQPLRADQVRETNLIHLDVLQRLLDSPMVICDLSSRNPNVLFELGLRQAFDKPVVLVQEVGTPKIFDIAPLRFTEYRRARIYHEVIEDQTKITDAIIATREASDRSAGVNSIVRILSLTRPAALPDVSEASKDPALQLIRAELAELRSELRNAIAVPAAAAFALAARDLNISEPQGVEWLITSLEERLVAARDRGQTDSHMLTAIATERARLREALKSSRRPFGPRLLQRVERLEDELTQLSVRLNEAAKSHDAG